MRKTYDATFLRRGRLWVAWSADVPGALTQGRTLTEARENLRDAIRLMLQPADTSALPKVKVVRAKVLGVKRRDLIQHLEQYGCRLLKEGSRHSRYVNVAELNRQATVPRHREIDDFLARLICRQLGIPQP